MNRTIVILGMLMIMAGALLACEPGNQVPENAGSSGDTTSPLESSSDLAPSLYLPDVSRISAGEVKDKLASDSRVVVVDSRSRQSYNESHITWSISVPLSEMAEPYADLEGYDEIYLYCT